MEIGDRVRVKSGEYAGETGQVFKVNCGGVAIVIFDDGLTETFSRSNLENLSPDIHVGDLVTTPDGDGTIAKIFYGCGGVLYEVNGGWYWEVEIEKIPPHPECQNGYRVSSESLKVGDLARVKHTDFVAKVTLYSWCSGRFFLDERLDGYRPEELERVVPCV